MTLSAKTLAQVYELRPPAPDRGRTAVYIGDGENTEMREGTRSIEAFRVRPHVAPAVRRFLAWVSLVPAISRL